MAEIRVHEGESLENALRRFKRKVQTEDIIKEVKRHSFYLRPGEKRVPSRLLHESVRERKFAESLRDHKKVVLSEEGSLRRSMPKAQAIKCVCV